MSYVKLVRSKIIKIKIKKLNLGFVLWTLCSISDIITSFLYLHIIHPSFFVEFGLSLKFHNDPHHYLFTMPRTPDSFHWKLGLWLLQFNSHASFFVIFVHSKFVPFLTHSSTLKWKFIFRILNGSNSDFQIKISKFWITLTGIIWCSASKSRDVIKTIALISSSFTTMISHVIKPPLRSVIQYLSREPEIKYRPGFGVNPWWRIS